MLLHRIGETFLSSLDQILDDVFDCNVVLALLRYVDDCLVVLKKLNLATQVAKVQNILELFNRHGKSLAF